ncbi:MAG TPA: hypothetical protein VL171_13950 [Verrucomicrobiae bacterium]|nr:hypothetical protein [Verrucomicrobiae bacterium]
MKLRKGRLDDDLKKMAGHQEKDAEWWKAAGPAGQRQRQSVIRC